MTAENPARRPRPDVGPGCFNEAAADDRGKPWAPTSGGVGPKSFNEAAADDRGKPPAGGRSAAAAKSLQ